MENFTKEKPKMYGPYKFSKPNKAKIEKAMDLGKLDNKQHFYYTYDADLFYKEIGSPKKGDWLWDQRETGENFNFFSKGMYNSPTKRRNVIYINNCDVNMEGSFLTGDMLSVMEALLDLYYPNCKGKVLSDSKNFEKLGTPSRQNDYLQYNAGVAIQTINKLIPNDGFIVIGLTSFDLYPSDECNFVFGLANKMEGCGVFSFKRYYEEMTEQYSGDSLIKIVTKLAGKVMIHEVGHLLGLAHCIYYSCLMNGSNHMKENLGKPMFLCPVCLRKVQHNLKFDVMEMYTGMKDGLTKLDSELYSEEVDWLEKRIESLKSFN